ncbi:hypothetical protein E2C01_039154 [Portunus trituberculatus]|uniref:DUF7041 domain-containing protein n=1 Tax=Portunus trituberculatus TaxID=210409 RepID=A0A5B7FIW5_PORTR|nr:hypothetical protein [Portunus trituberculatus]
MAEKVKLPPFTPDVDGWLTHVEAILAGRSLDQKQKHNALVSALPTDVVYKVREPVVHPPTKKPFDNLKEALIQCYKKPDRVYFNELQKLMLGDDPPSSLWYRMTAINSWCTTPLPDPLLCQFLLRKLPTDVQLIQLCAVNKTSSDGTSAVPHDDNPIGAVASVKADDRIENLLSRVSSLKRSLRLVQGRNGAATPCSGDVYWYHTKFGRNARQRRPPCCISGNGQGGEW